ncbi:MAG TPA: hypothetical protein VGF30_00950 [Bacteroidia bacterium]
MRSGIKIISAVIVLLVVVSCGSGKKEFEVLSFNPVNNKEFNKEGNVNIQADLSDAVITGMIIPTTKQCEAGNFVFDFTLQKEESCKEKLYYRLYYQNESYKFDEKEELSDENFYGSWENTAIGFKPIPDFEETVTISDSFRIIGNPRDEKKYYGSNPHIFEQVDSLIAQKKAIIKNSPEWYAEILKKAKRQKIAPEEQVHLDALWAVEHDKEADKSFNNRWKRNPRVGEYKIMLVVLKESELKKTPNEIQNIGQANDKGKFMNPFSYFMADKQITNGGIVAHVAEKKIKVLAKMDLGSGIYIGRTGVNKVSYATTYYNGNCGDQEKMYRKAQFKQYFHYINHDFPLKNIPEIMDAYDPAFTIEKYEEFKKKYEQSNKFVDTFVNSSDCPCKTVISDSSTNTITLVNPGNKEGEYKKEHVGIVGRVGFTYGKWRAKIKFPELINKYNVWNGLTNAFWLLCQEGESDWNMRRICNADIAYVPRDAGENDEALKKSKPQTTYSEIDFEMIKESQFWPKSSYGGKEDYPREDASKTDDIMVTCTNWDLACHEPKNFNIGAVPHTIEELEFVHHRWDHWYRALTTKVPAKNKEVFGGDYYYFEIDWQPTKIVWRIGPEKDKMRIVCIMDQTVSAIPNNQMSALVTQEWHNQEWWPTAPFKQNFVPFPKNDIVGKVLEIEVE